MPSAQQMAQHIRTRAQRQRRDVTRFRFLDTTPHDFGSVPASGVSPNALVLPGNARLAISHSAGLSAGDVTVDVGPTFVYGHPALAADVVARLGHGWQGQTVNINRGAAVPAGTLTLYRVDPFGRHKVVGTATFA